MISCSSRTKVSIASWSFSAIATTNAPLAKLQWFVINSTNLCLELAQKRLLLNLSSEMAGKTLWKTKRPHHSCEGLRLTSSWLLRFLQNRTISGRSEVFTVFAAAFFLFSQRWKEWKIKACASDFYYVWIEKSPQILDKKSTALKTEAPLLLVLDKQCPCPALPKQQA